MLVAVERGVLIERELCGLSVVMLAVLVSRHVCAPYVLSLHLHLIVGAFDLF